MKKNKRILDSSQKHYLKILGIVLAGILFYAIINNLGKVGASISFVLDILSPITIGLCLAFVLNLPLKFFERKVFGKLTRKNGKIWTKLKRPICLTLSIVLVFALLALIISFILPQFVQTCANFFLKLPDYMNDLSATVRHISERFNLPIDFDKISINWEEVSVWALSLVTNNSGNITAGAIEIVMGLVNGIINLVLGFFFSIYILASKEALGKLCKSLVYAFMERENAKKLIGVVTLSNRAFTGFVSGQCVEVGLIGVLCFIGMLIFRMPHPLMVSFIIAVTAFVPVFGPIVGSVIGALLILIVDPAKALWFLLFIIILQQIESNVLYPRIMGKHVNLPGIWVLVAVTVGGGLFGVLGIIVSIPLCSVCYTLFNKWLAAKLESRNICHASMSHDASEPNYIFDESIGEIVVNDPPVEPPSAEPTPQETSTTDDTQETKDE